MLGDKVKAMVEQKKLVADELIVEVLHKIISEKGPNKNILIDGFPRTLSQAVTFESIVGECAVVVYLTTKEEVLAKRLEKKGEETKAAGYSQGEIKKRIEEYMIKAQPVVDYYTRLGKLRTVDCSGSILDVNVALQKALFPQLFFVIGPKSSGKTEVDSYLTRLSGSKTIHFSDWASKFPTTPPHILLTEFLKSLHADPCMRITIHGFPTDLDQFKSWLLLSNGTGEPIKIIYLKATEGRCMMNNHHDSTTSTLKSLKEFYQTATPLLTYAKSKGLLAEITNSEDTPLEDILRQVKPLLMPEVVLARAQENSEPSQKELENLVRTMESKGFLHIDAEYMEHQEIVRKTKLGCEISQLRGSGHRPNSMKIMVDLFRKFVYPAASGCKKFILTGFPSTVEELHFFEQECADISCEFYFGQLTEFSASETTLETYMQAAGKLVALSRFDAACLDSYIGNQLQYVLVAGASGAGKTTAAKRLEKLGFLFMDLEIIGEDVKK